MSNDIPLFDVGMIIYPCPNPDASLLNLYSQKQHVKDQHPSELPSLQRACCGLDLTHCDVILVNNGSDFLASSHYMNQCWDINTFTVGSLVTNIGEILIK